MRPFPSTPETAKPSRLVPTGNKPNFPPVIIHHFQSVSNPPSSSSIFFLLLSHSLSCHHQPLTTISSLPSSSPFHNRSASRLSLLTHVSPQQSWGTYCPRIEPHYICPPRLPRSFSLPEVRTRPGSGHPIGLGALVIPEDCLVSGPSEIRRGSPVRHLCSTSEQGCGLDSASPTPESATTISILVITGDTWSEGLVLCR